MTAVHRHFASFCRTILVAFILLVSYSAYSQTTYWSRATGVWSDVNTWSTTSSLGAAAAAVPVDGDFVIIERDFTVTVDAAAACETLQLGTLGAAGGIGTGLLDFSGVATQLTVDGPITLGENTNGTITFASDAVLEADALTFGGAGGGQGFLDMSAGGTLRFVNGGLTIAGTGTWTPGLGEVIFASPTTLPASIFDSFHILTVQGVTANLGVATTIVNASGAVNVNNGTLAMGTFTLGSVDALNLSGGAITGTAALTLAGDVTTSASATVSSIGAPVSLAATRIFTVADNAGTNPDLQVTSVMSGAAFGITKEGTGTMRISGVNLYTGATTINDGVLLLGVANVINNGSAVTITSPGILDLNGVVETVASIAGTGTITSTAAGTIRSGVATNTVFSGNILNAVGVVKLGSGSLTLSGTNTYTGTVAVNAGTLTLGSTSALGTTAGGTTVLTTAALNLNGINYTAAEPLTLNGTGITSGGALNNTGGGAATFDGAITLGSSISIVATQAINLGGSMSGAFDLTKGGAAALSFGANPVSVANLTISTGTLVAPSVTLTATGNFVNSGTFTHNNGTVALTGAAQSISSGPFYDLKLSNSGTKTATGNLTITNSLDNGGAANNPIVLNMGVYSLSSPSIENTNATIQLSGAGVAASTGTVEYAGSFQSVAAGTYHHLKISQASGDALLTGATTAQNQLTLNTGKLVLGANDLTVGVGSVTVASPSATKMIVASDGGSLTLTYTGAGTYSFPIGDNTGVTEYSPLDVTFGSVGAGTITASVADAKHPSNASTSNYVTRYWNVSQTGLSGAATLAGTYLAADVVGTEADIRAAHLNGTFNQTTNPWESYAAPASSVLTAAGITTISTASSFTGINGIAPTVVINQGATASLCNGASLQLTTTASGNAPLSYAWTVAGAGPISATTISNPVVSPTADETYTITVTDGNGMTATDNIIITVIPAPTLTGAAQPAAVCAGSGAAIDLSGLVAGTTSTIAYTINGVAQAPVAGVVADGSGDGSFTTANLAAANDGQALVVTGITITSAAPNCFASFSQSVVLNVDLAAAITIQPTLVTSCEATTVQFSVTAVGTDVTYQWEVDDGGGFDPIVNGGIYGGATTSTLTLTGILLGMDGYMYHVIVDNGGASSCVSAPVTSNDVELTVKEIPDATATSVSICDGQTTNIAITNPNSVAGVSFTWTIQSSTNVTGASASTGALINQGITSTDGINPGTVVYSIVPSAVGCVGTAFAVTAIVQPAPSFTATNAAAEICSGSQTDITLNTPITGGQVRLKTVTYGAVTGTLSAGLLYNDGQKITETLLNSTAAPVTVQYVFEAIVGSCGPSASLTRNVIVNPNPTFTVTNNAPSICSGDDTDIAFASATTGHQINVVSVNYGAVTGGAIVAGTDLFFDTDVLAETLSNATTAPISVVYEFNVTTPGTTPDCPLVPVSQFVTVVVEPNPILTSALTIADLCSGSLVTYTPTSSTAGATFAWSRATIGGISPTGPISGTGVINETLSNSNNGPVTVTYVYTVSANGCTNATTYDVDVIVNPNPTFTVTNNAPSICSGDDTDIAFASATTGHQINVVSVNYGAVTGGAIVAGTDLFFDTDVLAETLSNATTAPISVVYEFNVTTPGTTPDCPLVPVSQFVTVVVEPNPILTSALTIADLCSGSLVTYTPTSSTAGATFAWSRATIGGISPTGPITGTGVINETLINSNNGPVTVTYVYTVSANGCTNATTYDVDVVVNPNPSFTATNNAPSICSGDDTDIAFASATTGHQINVVSVNYGAVTGGAIVAGTDLFFDTDVLAETLSNATTAPISVVYEFNVTTPGTTPDCPLVPVSQFVTVVVEPNPILTSALTIADLCSGSLVTYTPTSSTAGATFAWSRATIGGISPTGPISGTGVINETLSNSNNGPVTVTYVYTVSANGCTNATTYDVDVIVNPNPTFTVTNNAPSICSGDDTDIAFASATTGHQINVVSVNYGAVTGGAIVAGTDLFFDTDVLTETLSNATTAPISVVYEFNVTTPGTTPDCPLVPVSQFVTVVVEPNPILTSALTIADLCSGSLVTYTPTSSTAGATFAWSRATIGGISPTGPITGTGVINETLSNSNNGPVTVTYVYTVSANGCTNATTYDVDVIVNPNPTFTVTNNAPSICSGDDTDIAFASATTGHQINVVSVNYGAVTGGAIVAGTDLFFDTDVLAETLSNATTAPISVVYEFNVTTPGTTPDCPLVPVSQFVTVVVEPNPILTSALTIADLCSGSLVTYTPTSSTAGATFAWSRATIGGISPTGPITGTGVINETLSNSNNGPVTVTYVYTVSANGCTNATTYDVDVIVNPNPTFTVTNNAPSICSGDDTDIAFASATTGHQINVVSVNYGAVTGGAIVAGTDLFFDTDVLTETLSNATTAPISVVYEFNVTTPGTTPDCPLVPVSQFVTVVVEPNPILTSALTIADLCSGSLVTYTPTSSTAGATFAWSRATIGGISPTGPISGTGVINETLSNSNNGPVTVTYVYTVSANGCTNATTYDVDVIVNPNPTFTVTNNAPSICSGDDTDIAFASATTGHQINVVSVNYGAVTGGAIVAGTDLFFDTDVLAETLSNATTAPISVVYEFNVTTPGTTPDCPLVPVSQFVTVVVEPNPILTSALTIADLCSGSLVTYTPTSSTAGATFAWSRATIGGISPTGPISGTGVINETLINSNNGPVTVTYVYTVSANGCTNATTYDVDVVVNPNPSFTATNNAPSICSGDDTDIAFASATTGHQINVVSVNYGAVTGGAIVAGTDLFFDTDVLAETLSNATTAPISVVYEFNVTTPGTTPDCPLVPVSQFVTVVVEPNPILTSALTIADLCSGSLVTYTPTSSTAGATFAWSRATIGGISPTGPISGTGVINETLSNSNNGPVTVTYVYTVSANGCTNATTYDVDVIVNPNPTFTVTNNAPSICSGDDTDIAFASATTGHQINVVSVNYGAVTGGAIVAGTDLFFDTDVLAETLSNATTAPISVVYEFNVTTPGTTPDCPLVPVSQFVTVVVEPNPILTSALTIADLCSGSLVTYTPTSSTAGATFAWSRATIGGISPTGPITGTGVINETLSNSNNGPVTVTYVYTVSANGCTNATTYDVDVIVNPNPTFTVTNNAPSICSGDDTDIAFASATTGHQINVVSVNYGAVTGGAIVAGTDLFFDTDVLAETLSNATTAPISVVYEFNVTTPGTTPDCPLVPVSQFVTVVVEPNPILTSALTIADLCSGSLVTYTPTSSTAGATFAWSRATIGGISPTGPISGTGVINETLSNSNNGPVTVTYVYTVSANGCTNATTYDVDVIVNPNPTFTVTNNAPSICSGDDTDIAFASATTGHQINVVSVNYGAVTGGAIVAGTDLFFDTDVLAETLSNATTAPISVVYEFNVTTPGTTPDCPLVPVSQFVTVVVNPSPVLNSLPTADICSGSLVTYIPTSTTAGATFAWTASTPGSVTGFTAAGSGTIADVLFNTTNAADIVEYVIIPTANSCDGAPFTLTVTVEPTPTLVTATVPASAIVCDGDGYTIQLSTLTVPSGGTVVYDFTAVGSNAGVTSFTTSGSNIAAATDITEADVFNSTTSRQTITYTITPQIIGSGTGVDCSGTPVTIVISVDPDPVGVAIGPVAICSDVVLGSGFTLSTTGGSVSAASYTIQSITNLGGLTPSAGAAGGTGTGFSATALIDDSWRNQTGAQRQIIYNIIPVSSAGCNGAVFTVTVNVDPEPATQAPVVRPAICSDVLVAYTLSVAGATSYVVSANGGTLTRSAGAGTPNDPSDDSWTNVSGSVTPVNVVYTVTPVTGTCSGDVFTVTVPVKSEPLGVNAAISTCSRIALTYDLQAANITALGNGMTSTFQWQAAAHASVSGETTALTAGGVLNDNLVNTTAVDQVVVYTVTPTSGGCAGNNFTVSVTVQPEPVGVAIGPVAICSDIAFGTAFTLSTTAGSVSPASYTIQSVTNAGGLTVSGGAASATGAGFSGTALVGDSWRNQTGAQRQIIYNIIPVSSAGCNGQVFTVTVNVDPEPATQAPVVQAAICSDVLVAYTLSVAGATSYVVSANGGTLTRSAGAGTPNDPSDDSWTNVSGSVTPVNVVYTVTPVTGSCNGDVFTVTVPVKSEPFGVNAAISTCSRIALTYDLQAANITALGNGMTSTFQWQAAAHASVSGETTALTAGGVINDNLVNTTAVNQTVVYTVTPTSGGCAGNTFTVSVTVQPEPVGVAIGPVAICSDIAFGTAFTLSTTAGSVSPASYTIQSVTNAGGLTVSGGAASATGAGFSGTALVGDSWRNQTGAQRQIIYNIIPVSSAGCNGQVFTVTVNVDPEPATQAPVVRPAICSDVLVAYTLSVAGATSYVVSANGGTLTRSAGASTPNDPSDDSWTNVSGSVTPVNVVYTVTPVTGSCNGDVFTVTVPVKSEPLGVDDAISTCSRIALTYNLQTANVTALGNGMTSTFQWQAAAHASVSGETTALTAGGVINDNLVNTTAVNQTVVYTVTPTSGGCAGNSFTVSVTVEPEPVGVAIGPVAICSDIAFGTAFTLSTTAGSVSPASYTIQSVTNAGGLTVSGGAASATGAGFSGTALVGDSWRNQTGAQRQIIYNIIPVSSAGCNGQVFTVTVNVDPEPATQAPVVRPAICSDVLVAYTLSVAGATSYVVSANGGTLTRSAGASTPNDPSDDSWTNVSGSVTPVNVVYTVTPVTGSCNGDVFTVTVPVKSEPLGIDAAVVICSRTGALGYDLQADNITPVGNGMTSTFQWQAAAHASVSGETTALTSGALINDNLVNITGVDQVVVYTVTPTSASCAGNSFIVSVTVQPEPVGVAIPASVICSDVVFGNSFTLTTTAGSVSPASYTIQSVTNLGGLTVSGGSASATGTGFSAAALVGDSWRNQTGAQRQIIYNIIPVSSAGCNGQVFTVTVNVDPEPATQAPVTVAAVCSDVAVAYVLNVAGATSYVVSANGGALVRSGGAGTPNDISDDSWTNVNGSVTPVNVVYTVTPVTGTCNGDVFTVTVPVKSEPLGVNTAISTCSRIALTYDLQAANITALGNGMTSTFQWQAAAHANVTGETTVLTSGALINDNLVNITGVDQVVVYTVTPTSGGCTGNSFTVSVTVQPEPVGVAIPASVICSDVVFGNSFTLTTTAGSVSPASYTIQSVTNLGGLTVSGGSASATGTGFSAAALVGDSWRNQTGAQRQIIYNIIPVSSAGCNGQVFTVTVNVDPEPATQAPVTVAAVCSDVAVAYVLNVAGATSYVVSANGGTLVRSGGAGTPNDISDDSWTNVNGSVTPVNVVYTVTPVTGTCNGDVFTVTVPIKSEPLGLDDTVVICSRTGALGYDLQAANITALGNGMTSTFQWQAAAHANVSGETTALTSSGVINDNLVNITAVDQVVVYTVTPTSGGCIGNSFTVSVTVQPEPVGVAIPASVICSDVVFGNSFTLTTTAGSVSPASYTIQSVTNLGGLTVSGGSASATGTGFSAAALVGDSWRNQTGAQRQIIYNIIPVSSSGCNGQVFTVTVNIDPEPATQAPVTVAAVCSDVAVAYVLNVAGATSYVVSANGGTLVRSGGAGTPNDISDDSWTNVNGSVTPVNVVYTVTPVTGTCNGDVFTVTVPIKSEPLGLDDTVVICSQTGPLGYDLQATNITALGNGMTSTFQWQAAAHANVTGETTTLTGATLINDNLVNTTAVDQVVVYTITATSGGCAGDNFTISVTVHPAPALTSPNTIAAICSGGLVTYAPLSTTPGATFSWTRANQASITPAGIVSGTGSINETLNNTGTSDITVNYVYTVTANGCTNPTTFTVSILVKPIPVSSISLTPSDICSGTLFTYTPTSLTPSMTYTWSRATVAGITPAGPTSGTDVFINETLNNTTTTPLVVTYKVIMSSIGCTNGPTGQNVVLTVNPNPVLSSTLAPPAICSGTTFSYTPTSATVGATFTWVRTPIAGISSTGAASGSGPVSATLTNSTALPIDVTYVYTTLANGCSVDEDVVVTVNPIPVLTSANSIAALCSGSVVNYTPTSSTPGATFTWTRAFQTIITPAGPLSGSGSISETLNNTGNIPMTVVYKYTVSGNSCTNPTLFNVSVVVNPNPTFTVANSAPLICSGADTNILFASPTSGHSINLISVDYGNATGGALTGGVSTFNDGDVLAETLSNTTNLFTDVTYVFNVTTPSTTPSCPLVPVSQTVVVRVEPSSAFSVTNSAARFCSGNQTSILLNTSIVSAQIRLESVNYGAVTGTLSSGALYTNGQEIAEVLTNATSAPVTVTYTFEAVVGSCGPSPQQTATVIVDPIPTLATNLTTQELCEGQLSTVVLSNPNGVSGTQYIWTVAVTGISGAANQPTPTVAGAINTPLTLVTTGPLGTANYTIRSTANGCQSVPGNVQLTLRRQALVSVPVATTLCEPSVIPLNGTVSGGATTGLWSVVTGLGTLSATNVVTGPPIQANSSYAVDQGDIAGSVTMRLTTNDPDGPSGLCQVASADYTIAINRSAKVNAGPDLEQCADLASIQLQGSSLYSPTGVLWTKIVGAGTFSNDASTTSSYSFANPSEINQTLTLELTALDPDGVGSSGPCPSVSDQMTLKVNPLPVVNYVGMPNPSQIPENDPAIVMTGNQIGGLFTIAPATSVIGATMQNPTDEAQFDPTLATLGVNTITYTYTDLNGCTDVDIQTIRVDPVTTVDFIIENATLTATQEWLLCADQGKVRLIGNPSHDTGVAPTTRFHPDPFAPTGTLYGNTISIVFEGGEYKIDTDGLVSDTYYVRYTYKNGFGGITYKNSAVRILASPNSIISVANSCIKDAINFTDASTLPPTPFPASIISWRWDFDDQSFSNVQNPSHGYIDPDFYDIELLATTDQGCSGSSVKQIRVGDVPDIDFKWSAICNNESTNFENLSTSDFSSIDQYTWDFEDGTVISGPPGVNVTGAAGTTGTYDNPSHAFTVFGKYSVNLQIHTNDGCDNSIEQEVFILEYSTVNVDINAAYREDFQAGPGVWIAESLWKEKGGPTVNVSDSVRYSWEWGDLSTAQNITPATAGNNAWWTGRRLSTDPYGTNNPRYTNPNTYFTSETSAVNGPCFNLTGLSRPMVMLDYWTDSEKDRDGAVLQFSVNGGNTWRIVGPLQGVEGINWYNSSGIVGKPGNQAFGDNGWSGKGGGWVTARFNLDAIPYAERDQVRLRIAFGSEDVNDTQNTYDGFAFDNFFVGEKRRNVLVENFTNVYPASVASDNHIESKFLEQISLLRPETKASDFHVINYHLNQPKVDPLNRDNPTDPGTRALYMSVSYTPFTILDGNPRNQFTGQYLEVDKVAIDRRSLEDPQFLLELDSVTLNPALVPNSNNKINPWLKLTALEDFNGVLLVNVALIENNVGPYKNVLRKLLFGPDGLTITNPWSAGAFNTYDQGPIEINVPITNPDSLTMIAFVQNKVTKEIYQSAVLAAPIKVGGVSVGVIEDEDIPTALNGIKLYPNPADNQFSFFLPGDINQGFEWRLSDQRGIVVASGTFDGAFDHKLDVDISSLSNGVYIVMIAGPDKTVSYQKLVILNHR